MFSIRSDWNWAKTQFGIVLEYLLMRCDGNLAKTQFGTVLEYFRCDAIGIWLRHNLKLSWDIFN